MLRIHVLNVGHGDCIVIEFPGRLSVIDINRAAEMDKDSFSEIINESLGTRAANASLLYGMGLKSYGELLEEAGYTITLTDPIDYIKKLSNGNNVFRFISTHPHMDHLSGLKSLSDQIGIINFWVQNNAFKPDLNKLSDSEKEDWAFYEKLKKEEATGIKIVRPAEGDKADFWQQDGIYILAPNSTMISSNYDSPNNFSYVLLVVYGKHKVVLGGDAEKATWDYLVKQYPEQLKNVTILKASHHGRDSGYHQEAVKLMSPNCTVVSVGKKPESDASQKYSQYSKSVLSTRWYGTICFDLNEDGTGTYKAEFQRN